MQKKKTPNMVKTAISIKKEQLEWIEKNHYNLSSLTRAYLDEFIRTMTKTKEGIVVPAWVKMADKKTFKEMAKKNPRLKKIVGD